MRTIEKVKDEIVEFYFYATTVEGKLNEDSFIQKLDELIETAATLQREKCTKEAMLQQFEYETDKPTIASGFYSSSGNWISVNKNSILNAKL